MDNSAEKNPLTRWVDEMQGVMKMITGLIADNDRNRAMVEAAQREQGAQREEIDRLRAEVETQRTECDRQRSEVERQRSLVKATERERDDLRTEIAALYAETDRLRTEQNEAGETAAKLLGEMKDLVNQVAHKFQGPSKSSPFAREPRSPQP